MAEGDGRGGNTAGRGHNHYMPGRGVPLTPEAEDFAPDAFADNIEEPKDWQPRPLSPVKKTSRRASCG